MKFLLLLIFQLQLLWIATATSSDIMETYKDSYEILGWSNFTVRHKDRVILNLSGDGSIHCGRILGILGPSG